jgi:hypothetical protein
MSGWGFLLAGAYFGAVPFVAGYRRERGKYEPLALLWPALPIIWLGVAAWSWLHRLGAVIARRAK